MTKNVAKDEQVFYIFSTSNIQSNISVNRGHRNTKNHAVFMSLQMGKVMV